MSQDTYNAPSLVTSGTNWAAFQLGGITEILKNLIAANPAQANPTTQATVTATGGGSSGGNLPAGTYRGGYTWYDGAGETTMGTSESATFTISAGNIPQMTIPALPTGVCQANIYLTLAGGAAGTETLYMTGVTGTTVNLSYAAGTDFMAPAPPASNTTGMATVQGDIGVGPNLPQRLGLKWVRLSDLVSQYISGNPVGFWAHRLAIGRLDYVMAAWKQATKEAQTLIAANPGTVSTTAGPVMPITLRGGSGWLR
jgi:hypothetical protein